MRRNYRSITVQQMYLVLPSDRPEEAFGLVQIEAHASGRPVVCCALPTGVTKVNLHGKTGLVVPLKEPQSMAEAINNLLENPSLRMEYGRNAQERAYQEFSIKTMCNVTTPFIVTSWKVQGEQICIGFACLFFLSTILDSPLHCLI